MKSIHNVRRTFHAQFHTQLAYGGGEIGRCVGALRISTACIFNLSRPKRGVLLLVLSSIRLHRSRAGAPSEEASKRQRLLVALQRSESLRRSASRPAVGPPTRAIAGARGHHDHRAATVTPQLKRLMLTEMEDQPRAARRARRRRGARAFPLGAAATPRDHACSSHLFLSEGPPHRDRRERAACHRPDLEATIRAFSHR